MTEDKKNDAANGDDHIWLMGVRVHKIEAAAMLEKFNAYVAQRRLDQPRRVMYVNTHCHNMAYADAEYRAILNHADIVYPDGIGIIIGAKILCGGALKERATAADFLDDYCADWAARGYGLYLFAAEQGVAEDAGKRLTEKHPGLRIVGTHTGYFDESESEAIIEDINAAAPDILVVGLGSPKQEKWIERHYAEIRVPVIWPVGALLDFVVGKEKRVPKIFRKVEWLYRLLQNPGHKWRRYIIGNTLFLCRAFRHKLTKKNPGG